MDEDCGSDRKETQRSIMKKRRQNGAKIETGGGKMGSENVGKRKPKTTTTGGKGDRRVEPKDVKPKVTRQMCIFSVCKKERMWSSLR